MSIGTNLLNRTATISRPSSARTAMGDSTVTFAVIETARAWTVQPRPRRSQQMEAGRIINGSWLGFMNIDANVELNDRITDEASGIKYMAVVVEDAAGRAHHFELGMEVDRRG